MCGSLGFDIEKNKILIDYFGGSIWDLSKAAYVVGPNSSMEKLIDYCNRRMSMTCGIMRTAFGEDAKSLSLVQKEIWPLFLEKEYLDADDVKNILGHDNFDKVLKGNLLFHSFLLFLNFMKIMIF